MKSCELNMKMIVPSSIGILAVTSGICLLLWHKNLRKRKGTTLNGTEKEATIDDSRCACCLKPFFIGRGIECNNCNSRSCSKGCSRWDIDENIWLCLFCHHRRSWLKKNEKWFETFGGLNSISESTNQFSTAKSQVCITGTEHVALNSGLDLAAGGYEERNTMESVRDFIENIVENLVGSVGNTPINHLYKHPAYDQLFNEFSTQLAGALTQLEMSLQSCISNKPATDTPSMAQTTLRQLVERAVDEARKLPGLGESVSTTQIDSSIEKQSYEDLLATAILNKVIEKYQKEHSNDNSNVVHEKSSRKCKHKKNNSNGSINEDDDTSSLESSMSHDECSSDCSDNRMSKHHPRQDSLSLKIEEQIEEITTLYTSDEDSGCMKTNILNFQCARRVPFPEFGMDIVDPAQESSDESQDEIDGSAHVDHITPIESWEENWLFQKKKISIQSDPVTMLVPNPNEDFRALIGDKDAEDTSDLSEISAHSDDEIEDEIIEAINCVIPNSLDEENIPSTVDVDAKIVIQDDEYHNKADDIKYASSKEICVRPHIQNTNDISISKDASEPHESIMNAGSNDNTFVSPLIGEKKNYENNDNKSNLGMNEIELINPNNLENHKTPKTPASSPIRNSFSGNDRSSIITCNVEELKEKLGSIDKNLRKSVEIVRESHADVTSSEVHVTSQFLEQERIHESNFQMSSPPRPGTIAEREHRKWENAPPIQNNPYSQENIEKRLLERQYSRRLSDVNGNSAVLPTIPCPSMQIVIGTNRLDIKRFGRDYYINESKSPTGERLHRSGTSFSSRPSSSLSHRSNSTSSDFEQQENFEPIEVTSKSLEITQNNEISERERKNSKNEINAKLNNQGNFDSIATIFDTKKTCLDDDKRKIRRIDLRAYGFENEFNMNNNDTKEKQQRIPNKLDLRSYGYDSGLRRTQSNNQIDSRVNNSFLNTEIKSELMNGKLNLSHQHHGLSIDDDFNWTQSTENLIEEKKLALEKFNGIKCAKSVPNITKSGVYSYDKNEKDSIKIDDKCDDDGIRFSEEISRGYENTNRKGNATIDSSTEIGDGATDSTNDTYESDSLSIKTTSTDELPPRYTTLKELKHSLESLEDSDIFIEKKLPMPSVKILAQTFNKTPTLIENSLIKAPRSIGHVTKERPATPEIQIIGAPRQMHSLTARSISREFREGLRQITNKSNVSPINTTLIEQNKTSAESSKLNTDKFEDDINTAIIAPGRLKNNIQFWEQLQKKH